MKELGGKPLEPHYVSATFTDALLGDPTEHLVEIAQVEFLRSKGATSAQAMPQQRLDCHIG
jgi:hypothetical protein